MTITTDQNRKTYKLKINIIDGITIEREYDFIPQVGWKLDLEVPHHSPFDDYGVEIDTESVKVVHVIYEEYNDLFVIEVEYL